MCFPDYTGGNKYELAEKFIEDKFLGVNKFDPNVSSTSFVI
jgi:hypothetical protein